MDTAKQYRNRLNPLFEGIQIIDFNWRYIFINDFAALQSKLSVSELLGFTMMEKYPGIETTPLFEALQLTMNDRKTRRVENEFVFPDNEIGWFDLRIQPADEGICVLSIDITDYKRSKEEISRAKNLYAFLSHINQSIVHLTDEQSLFKSACAAAIAFGGFKIGWIGLFDEKYEYINLVEQCGLLPDQLKMFANAKFLKDSTQRQVIDTGTYFARNDIQRDLEYPVLRSYAKEIGIHSFIVLPVRKSGKIIGTFNLYSEKTGFAGADEIVLLEEVVTDISFALSNFEKEKTHRETRRRLIQNEKRFRALIEKSVDMKTLATAEGKLFYGSPSITKVLGYNLKKMVDVSLFDLIHPDDLVAFSKNRAKLVKKPGESFAFQARMKHQDNRWIWCEGIATNLLEESGVHAIVSNFRDISEKKKAEQRAQFDTNNTKALINNTDDLMWSVDRELRLITSNNAFSHATKMIYGQSLQKGDKVIREGLSLASRKQYQKFYFSALSGKSFRKSVRLSRPEGNWAEISFSPILQGDEIIGIACHSRDMTQRMQTEHALESQNKALIKTNFELDRFVYSVSHDLRSPLTSILGLLSFIEEESKEPDTLEHAAMIRSGIDRLDGFIKNILNYSRTNRTKIEVAPILVRETVAVTINALRNIKNAEAITFEVDVDENCTFHSDLQGFQTVLENLISNAIKFQRGDTEKKYICVEGKCHEDFLEMTIADNGIGIPEIHHGKIFDMFFRATAEINGSGIGLYIVREILTKLDGTIAVASEPGKGTTFHIRLKNLKYDPKITSYI